MKGQRFGLAACIAWGFGTNHAAAAVPMGDYRVAVEAGVRVSMRDGVGLVADVYRPDAPGKFPVLLERTPYNRAQPGTGARRYRAGYSRAVAGAVVARLSVGCGSPASRSSWTRASGSARQAPTARR